MLLYCEALKGVLSLEVQFPLDLRWSGGPDLHQSHRWLAGALVLIWGAQAGTAPSLGQRQITATLTGRLVDKEIADFL